jgi:NADPH:quinone reductase-like Zn-dependent oxidoreductase
MPDPHAKRGEVRIQVHVAGSNPMDWPAARAIGAAIAFKG